MCTKKLIMLIVLLFGFMTGMAQDIIVKKDGSSLSGKVVEVTDTHVKYHKADNPDGPLYSILISDLVRINYDNGATDVFSEGTPMSVLQGATGDVKDSDLLKMYNMKNNDMALPKKLKLTGYIGGGLLVGIGIGLFSTSLTYGAWESEYKPFLYSGIGLTVLGAGWMTGFCLAAKHKEKKLNELYSSSLYRHEIYNDGSKSLAMGVDYITDRLNTTRTLGLGMSINF